MLRAICQAATDPNTRARKSALFALEKIDKDLFDAAVRIVIEHGSAGKLGQEQKEGAEEVFENAIKWKREGKDAKAAVPLICCWWQYHLADRRASIAREEGVDTFDSPANTAIRALKEIVPDEKDTARAFTAWLLNDPNPTLRALLAESIPGLTHEKDCVKPLAISGRLDPDEKVRSAALAALRKVSGKQALKTLLASAQKDPSDEVRAAALELLGDLGVDAREAAPVVHDLCLDPSPTIRALAGAALKKITKDKP
jgi:HEAT repeat protein